MKRPTALHMLAIGAVLAAYGCSASPDPEHPGSCSLKCSSTVIPGRLDLQPMQGDIDITCAGDFQASGTTALPLAGPLELKFTAVRAAEYEGDVFAGLPATGIGVQPFILEGELDPQSTHPDNATVVTENNLTSVDPYKYRGVMTPKEQWCSDQCGVVTLELRPLCMQNAVNRIRVNLVAGANVTATPTTITIRNGTAVEQ